MDYVELVVAIEEAFQIHLNDDELRHKSTVGDLYELVVSQLPGRASRRCLTSHAFYRLRSGIAASLQLDCRAVRPSVPLAQLFPEGIRRQRWQRVERTMALKLPQLRVPPPVMFVLLTSGVGLAFMIGIHTGLGALGRGVLLVMGFLVSAALASPSSPLAVEFPSGTATVGDLARGVLARNHARLVAETGTWSRADAWEALTQLIVAQTSVAREILTPDTRIAEDLGLD